jgi:flagellar basal-body rod protein FlgC
VNLGDQMTNLIIAQRAYQLNLAVVDRARESYQQAININGR